MLDKLKQKFIAARQVAETATVEALPQALRTPEDVAKTRWDVCSSCEKLYKPTNTCKVCGCFMVVKTNLKTAKCPIGKWGPHTAE
jgi:hypothetical protein